MTEHTPGPWHDHLAELDYWREVGPQMLEALEAVRDHEHAPHSNAPKCRELRRVVRAAIAAARGEGVEA